MKRHSGLFTTLCGFQHLYRAYRKALRGSGQTPEAQAFQVYLEKELLALQVELRELSYYPAPYRYFHISQPKKRLISVAPFRDRVVHHAVVAALEPIFEPTFIYHSYATRKGKGTRRAVYQAQQFMRRYPWFFKADIDQYFASIDHPTLIKKVERKAKDEPFMTIVRRIIKNGGKHGKGLPIGNLTSQFFANVYLNPFDHFIKEELRVKGYLRYMDDFVLFTDQKHILKRSIHLLGILLKDQLKLKLKPTACFLNHRSNGLSFLGTRIFPQTIRIHPVNLKRTEKHMLSKSKKYQKGHISEEEFCASMNSHWAHLCQYDTLVLRQKWIYAKEFG